MFRRRKADDAGDGADLAETVDDELDGEPEDQDDAGEDVAGPDEESADELTAGPPARPRGPWDEADVPDDDRPRLNLGAVLLPGFDGLEIQVNVDQGTGVVQAVTAVAGESALQLQPFAAPRSEGIWAEVRHELSAEITRDGGVVDEAAGPFGPELHARVPVQQPDGSRGLAAVRFLGVDGPRWFLRGVVTGPAVAEAEAAAGLEEVFRQCVVVRGAEPMAPRDPLPLRLPDEAGAGAAEEPAEEAPSLNPFKRGPEITEIR